ncbi:GNAT family N-acetyltransferase [Streptomyces sp. NPDC088358]|uniref:GNAT family N-acetyltransferase n=1 Tax=Streptomyces sp. NPDC088358 TaxID=3365857 RepID=UPI0038152EE5
MLQELEVADGQFRVRDLEPVDEKAVLALFDAAEDWFTATTGQPAAPGDIQSLYYALPEGAAFEDKALLVIEADRHVVGLIDAVLHHPTVSTCSLGMFLVHPAHRRCGLGRQVASALFGELAARGHTEVVASVAEGWQPGRAFLAALGFTLGTPGPATNTNRNLGPGERPIIPARLGLPAVPR